MGITLLDPKLFHIQVLEGLNLEGEERQMVDNIWEALKDGEAEESVTKAARNLHWD